MTDSRRGVCREILLLNIENGYISQTFIYSNGGFMKTKLFVVFLILAVLISRCTGQKTVKDNMTEKPNTVLIKALAFDPATITVAKGTTVTWMNMDSASHTVVATGMTFRSGNLNNGQSFAHTFNETGTFEYKCGIHPSMSGKVEVE